MKFKDKESMYSIFEKITKDMEKEMKVSSSQLVDKVQETHDWMIDELENNK